MSRPPLASAAVTAAALASSPVAHADPASDLAAACAKWKSRGVSSYSYKIEYHAFIPLPPPTVVRVANGKPRGTPKALRRFDTVEELFARAGEAIATGGSVSIVYAANTGVPKSFVVDPNMGAVDDERSLRITQIRAPRGRCAKSQPVTRGAAAARPQTVIARVNVTGAVAEPRSKDTRIDNT